MIGTVAGRAVAVPPAIVAWQQPVESVHGVVVRSGVELDDHDPGRRMGHEDRQETISPTAALGDEPTAGAGQIGEAPF